MGKPSTRDLIKELLGAASIMLIEKPAGCEEVKLVKRLEGMCAGQVKVKERHLV
jgi:hypothetical protein